MKTIFLTILLVNIPIVLASFFFAVVLLRRGKNPIYFNFGMAVLSLALWSVAEELLFFNPFSYFFVVLDQLTFLFGIWIVHYFLIFTMNFPIPTSKKLRQQVLLYIVTSIISFSFFLPGWYTQNVYANFPFVYIYDNPLGLTIYAFYFFVLGLLSFKNLIFRYIQSDGILRIQLKRIIIGTALVLLINFFSSITIYYFSAFSTAPIGVFFTSMTLIYIYSILFTKKAN